MKKGMFITVEGIDGAGKSTQVQTLMQALKDNGVEFVHTREPGGPEFAEKIRHLLLTEDMTPKCEMLLMFAAREENLEKVVKPALAEGKWVVCDRFTDASYAYQAYGRQQPKELIDTLKNLVHPDISPDKTLLFDVDVDVAAQRLGKDHDRIESMERDFHQRVRDGYLALAKAEPDRFVVLDSSQPPEVVSEQIRQLVKSWL